MKQLSPAQEQDSNVPTLLLSSQISSDQNLLYAATTTGICTGLDQMYGSGERQGVRDRQVRREHNLQSSPREIDLNSIISS